jgi:hypothetical protein
MKENKENTNKYYEIFCMLCLKKFFGDKFSDLTHSDRPDLISPNIGVEVTRATIHTNEDLDAFIKKNFKVAYSSLNQKKLKKFGFTDKPESDCKNIFYRQKSKEHGILLYIKKQNTDEVLLFGHFDSFGTINCCIANIIKSAQKKLQKLNNKDFKKLKENDLALIVNEQLDYKDNLSTGKELINLAINALKIVYEKNLYKKTFDFIYILFLDQIFEINTLTWDYIVYSLSENEFNLLWHDTVKLCQ